MVKSRKWLYLLALCNRFGARLQDPAFSTFSWLAKRLPHSYKRAPSRLQSASKITLFSTKWLSLTMVISQFSTICDKIEKQYFYTIFASSWFSCFLKCFCARVPPFIQACSSQYLELQRAHMREQELVTSYLYTQPSPLFIKVRTRIEGNFSKLVVLLYCTTKL